MSDETRQTSAAGDSHARLAAITEATDAFIDAVPDIEALLGIVAEQISRTTGDFCAVVLLSPDGRTIEPVAAYHPDPRVMEDAGKPSSRSDGRLSFPSIQTTFRPTLRRTRNVISRDGGCASRP